MKLVNPLSTPALANASSAATTSSRPHTSHTSPAAAAPTTKRTKPTTTTDAADDVEMHDSNANISENFQQQQQQRSASQQPPITKKRKHHHRKENPHILHSTTFRKPFWTYFHLRLITPSSLSTTTTSSNNPRTAPSDANADTTENPNDDEDISPLTTHPLLTIPLSTYLGLTGSSIPIDILKTRGRDVWIRIPREDSRAFRAGVAGWVGGCEAGLVPGEEGRGRVKVSWRVLAESGGLGLLDEDGGGGHIFGGRV